VRAATLSEQASTVSKRFAKWNCYLLSVITPGKRRILCITYSPVDGCGCEAGLEPMDLKYSSTGADFL
jgi:hypothetical protein